MSERKVLIVEDDVDLATTLTISLQLKKHASAVAYNGQEAITLANQQAFDICFIDIKMPGMNGIECLQKIRGILPAGTVYIIMTGFRDQDTLEQAKEAGANSILLKPFNMSKFIACVDDLAC